jgi:hypothetical protein
MCRKAGTIVLTSVLAAYLRLPSSSGEKRGCEKRQEQDKYFIRQLEEGQKISPLL